MSGKQTFLGTVQDVHGATVSISLDKSTASGLAFVAGHGYRIGQIGSFVRIPIGFTNLFGIVAQVGAGAVPDAIADVEPFGYRWLKVHLVGESRRSGLFRRGVSTFPTIGDEAHLVTRGDLAQIYGSTNSPHLLQIGSLSNAESIPALVNLDRLVTRHSAIVGTTGAGKSTTVSSLLASLSDPQRYPSARILVFDLHGEYQSALGDRATVFRINADPVQNEQPLYIPYWALSFEEFLRMTPFRGISDADRGSVAEHVRILKRESLRAYPRPGITEDTLTVDTPIPFSIHRLWYDLHRLVCSTHTAPPANQSRETEAVVCGLDGTQALGSIMGVEPPRYHGITQGGANRVYLSGATLNIRRQLHATESLLRDTRYDFLFRPGPWCPEVSFDDLNAQPERDLDTLLSGWIGNQRPVSILDLSGVPVSIMTDLVGALLRLLFDALFWSRFREEGARRRPLLLVLEEAHNYLQRGSAEPAALAAQRIVKEGRKYGIGAMVVSQRPSEIDPTILSQCGTIVAMRLGNSADRSQVAATASDHLEGLFGMLPVLRTGEAIIVGEAVQLPLRALIDAGNKSRRPDSHDPLVVDTAAGGGWNQPLRTEDYGAVLQNWRSENPRSSNQESGNGQNAGVIQ